eukprot:Skav219851  [mRNA]  locus=scaffold859:555642:556816:- [translate_table: standard]
MPWQRSRSAEATTKRGGAGGVGGTLIREDRRRYVELQRRKLRAELESLGKAELVERVLRWCSTLGIWNLNDLDTALDRRGPEVLTPAPPRRRDECGRCGTKHLKDALGDAVGGGEG